PWRQAVLLLPHEPFELVGLGRPAEGTLQPGGLIGGGPVVINALVHLRFLIGAPGIPSGFPLYSPRGRIQPVFGYLLGLWAVQPDMRLTANTGVNRSTGMPRE